MVFLLQKGVSDEIGITAARLSSYCCQENVSAVCESHIYISCIKQFWNTAFIKRSGDVTRLQALVDKKKIVISEAVIREILQLKDVEGIVCLPNEEIFAGLAQMRYEKPVGKGFSGVETPLFEGMLVVVQPAEEGLVADQVQVMLLLLLLLKKMLLRMLLMMLFHHLHLMSFHLLHKNHLHLL
nr:hypothetical protein [Tanacetum cinerariifolium]